MPPTEAMGSPLDPRELEKYREDLLRFAMMQLRDRARAEDTVQETLVAAIQGIGKFAVRSSVRSWLTGILKHKIIDAIRKTHREIPFDQNESSHAESDGTFFFGSDGRYAEPPADWGDPEAALSQRAFFEMLEQCMESLPKSTARVFAMREVLGMDTTEVCESLGISASNCGVLLYRARMRLRDCVGKKWFLGDRR